MALSIVILAFSSILLLGFALRSRYGFPLFLMTAGMGIVSVAVLFQIFNTTTYAPPGYFPLRALDIRLFRFVGSNRFPLADVQRMRSLGCLMFFGGILLLLLLIIRNLKQADARKRWSVFFIISFILFGLIFMCYYSPACAYQLYLCYYALEGAAQEGFRLWMTRLDNAFHFLIILYAFSPVFLLLVQYQRRNITYFADTFSFLIGITVLDDTMFFTMFFTGSFAQTMDMVFRSGFWFFSTVVRFPDWITLIFLCFSLLLLAFILLSTRRIFNGELVLLSWKRALKNSIEELNRNLKDVLHSEKNLMFSIQILADEAKAFYGSPEGMEKLERLTTITQHRMEIITSSLNRIRELHLNAQPVDMRCVMDQALADQALPEDIHCEKRYCDYPARCVIDEYHTRSAIKNLFSNSVEALQLFGQPDKRISVIVDASSEWVSLSIHDNGPGIARQELHHVMLPFVSTKSKTTNWGIGLSYVFRIVNAQLGQMRIRSSVRPDTHYTQVDILLPRERRNGR